MVFFFLKDIGSSKNKDTRPNIDCFKGLSLVHRN